MPTTHLITLDDVSSSDVDRIFKLSADLKSKHSAGVREPLAAGQVLSLLFEKPSLRTRVSFESAMAHLGGSTQFLSDDVGFGKRESIADFARVLTKYVDLVVLRTKRHDTVVEFASYSQCPVINGLTDKAHPCQALADLFTIAEQFGSLAGRKLAYVGDANNVARSLARACGKTGVAMAIASPKGYGFSDDVLNSLTTNNPDLQLTTTINPAEAVRDASAVYTDVWASMGQEAEAAARQKIFADISGERAVNGKRVERRRVYALFAGQARPRGDRRGNRRAAEFGCGASGQSNACAKGDYAVVAGRGELNVRSLKYGSNQSNKNDIER